MSWIKRNLYFVIGTVVAVVLLGLAGFYLFSKWDLNNKNLEQLNQAYEDFKRLNQQNPHPGSGPVDNIKAAKEQQQSLRASLQQVRSHFRSIAPIPDLPKITDHDFSAALSRTLDQMRRDATNASVNLLPDYSFSFTKQRNQVTFAPVSLLPLSVQLGDVKAICGILFQAKINSLDYLRRERVSTDDSSGPQTDYLSEKSVTNEMAILTPYELTFRCFSPELASVLSGFAGSPNGLVVKTINVEQVSASPADLAGGTGTPTFNPVTAPAFVPPPPQPTPSAEDAFRRRYGTGPTGPGSTPFTPAPVPVAVAQPAPSAARGGLSTVLDEKQLKVTILLNVVKLAVPPATK